MHLASHHSVRNPSPGWRSVGSSLARQISTKKSSTNTVNLSGLSLKASASASPFSTSSHYSEAGSPWRENSQFQQLYRRTSRLVEDSDPVILSSSQRSNRERSSSSHSHNWQSPTVVHGNGHSSDWSGLNGGGSVVSHKSSPALANRPSEFRGISAEHAASPQPMSASQMSNASLAVGLSGSPASLSSESSSQNWPHDVRRYQTASTALYRSSSASRLPSTNNAAIVSAGSPLANPGFVPWALNKEMSPVGAPQDQRRDGSVDGRVPTSRRGPSPSRLDTIEYSSSPRVLETMPEGIEHHAASVSDNIGHFGHVHHRQRSTSSAAALGMSHATGEDVGHAWQSRFTINKSFAAPAGSAALSLAAWDGQMATSMPHYYNQALRAVRGGESHWDDGGETARQSPVDRRSTLHDMFPANYGDRSFDERASRGSASGSGRNICTFQGSAGAGQAAAVSTASSLQQHRAVGFELKRPEFAGPDMALDYEAGLSLESQTPRSRIQNSRRTTYGRSGFSDEDLAADLGQLNAELDKISAEQQQYDARHEARTRAINYRVPSSRIVATDAHAASMPPVFGGGGQARVSHGNWSSVMGDDEESWRGAGPLTGHPLSDATGSYPTSKSRSASLEPRPPSPADGRGHERLRAESLSAEQASCPTEGDCLRSSTAADRNSNAGAYGVQLQQHGRGAVKGDVTRRQSVGPAVNRTDSSTGFLPASLKTPSAAGAVQSGVNVSASSFAPPPQFSTASTSRPPPPSQQVVFDRRHITGTKHLQGVPLPNDTVPHSLAVLAPSAVLPGSGPAHFVGPSGFQELGRGVPLGNLPQDTELYIVGFKQGRTDLFFRQPDRTGRGETVQRDDLVIVEADRGKDIGRVVSDCLTTEQVRAFLALHTTEKATSDSSTSSVSPPSSSDAAAAAAAAVAASSSASSVGSRATAAARSINPKRLYAKASPADTSLLISKATDEERALAMCVAKVQQRGLPMHVVAAELQWDRRKLTFYYTAAARVDFRALVADLFKIWKLRVWMCDITTTRQQQQHFEGLGNGAGR